MLYPITHRFGEPIDWDNAIHLDEFYIAAAEGWDYETGQVVDAAKVRDHARQGYPRVAPYTVSP